jgi:hypothetical protein
VPADGPIDAPPADAFVAPCTLRSAEPPAAGGHAWTVEDTVELPIGGPMSVAVAGDVAVVGAVTWTPTAFGSGAARILVRNGNRWSVVQELRPEAPAESDYYGAVVAIAGDLVAVAAPSCTSWDSPRPGRVHVYARAGERWVARATLQASEAAPADCLRPGGRDLRLDDRRRRRDRHLRVPRRRDRLDRARPPRHPERVPRRRRRSPARRRRR